MSPKETSDEGQSGILAGLLAPLRVPERTLLALDALVEAVGNLGPMRAELTCVREQTEPLGELPLALERLEDRVTALHATLSSLQEDVQSVTERMPDASRGPFEKVHDVLTRGPADEKE